ncbi:unannotated protein [freshwater metagenome]|uniref:Unannotated protein n=1 Tax=freshwater metagenome TaxID=449393 RepID=A0A6J6KC25_9ZZZZ|nr:hypothetical protein [Actinomycetota bacterium]
MTYRDTVICVSDLVSFRMDTQTRRALQRLQQMGMSQSDAIRHAIQESAAALHEPKRLAAEMAALEADPIDRAEMLSIAKFMEELGE